MSKLSQTTPIKTVQTYRINQGKCITSLAEFNCLIQEIVRTYACDPILPKKENKKACQELHLLKQLSHLELVLEKINRLELWKIKGGLKTTDASLKVCVFFLVITPD